MTHFQSIVLVLAISNAVAAYSGFALGEKNAGYSCSPASLENAYIKGADRLYQQLVEQGRI